MKLLFKRKSVTVVMPGVAMHPGPVVCTSTKLEIAQRTAPAAARSPSAG